MRHPAPIILIAVWCLICVVLILSFQQCGVPHNPPHVTTVKRGTL